jgi:prephenate dehydratase
VADNETRFVWIAPAERPPGGPPAAGHGPTASPSVAASGTPRSGGEHGPWKTALVFWGVGSEAPGWLVRCLSELSSRGVNLTRIESRPRKQGLGRYMFFVELEGHTRDEPVAEAVAALRGHAETVRVLGSFTAA